MAVYLPYVPEYITVHLGPPSSYAQNVTLTFPDYIKNVASSEIYPTWEDSAITANIYAQISFALNRVYLNHYRLQGYNFNITNSTAYDQSFENGRNIFDNIDRIVDEIFTTYIRRQGFIEPLAAKYCNGTTVTCKGLSQWGSEGLAKDGLNSFEILTYYYGDDIELVQNTPIRGVTDSYPGTPVKLGDRGDAVIHVQNMINRVSQDYPLIPKTYPVDGIFGPQTEKSIKTFQEIFNLNADGIVGKATWNKLSLLYIGIKKLAELESEGANIFGKSLEYPDAIEEGNVGEKVSILQYFLSVISEFIDAIPFLEITGAFGPETKNAVIAFQALYNLPQTGIVDAVTWNHLYNTFIGIVNTVFLSGKTNVIQAQPFGGTDLKIGSKGENVKVLQQYINVISNVYESISPVPVTSVFGNETKESVIQYQKQFKLPQTGVVNRDVWNSITNTYKDVVSSATTRPTQYPGNPLKLGSQD